MRRTDRRALGLIVQSLAVALALGGTVTAGGRAEITRPDYRRDSAERPRAARPVAAPLPETLRHRAAGAAVNSRDDRNASTNARGVARPVPLLADAKRAATWAALNAARNRGFLEYYRIGFHAGLRVALEDDRLGAWDRLEGMRLGARDPMAGRIGADEGARAAEELAAVVAPGRAESQFLDLQREPRFDAGFRLPAFEPAFAHAPAPVLREIFVEVRLPAGSARARRFDAAFRGWGFDPWELHGCQDHGRFYDSRWDSPEAAFDLWLIDRRRSRVYRELGTAVERDRFEQAFAIEFRRRLARILDREVLPGYEFGFDDGWEFGGQVQYERNFRLGYNEGFDRMAETAARTTFGIVFGNAYRRHYEQAFAEWQGTARPGILEMALFDADDDGIFEPGETVLVEYELANFGGVPGEFELRLGGRHLERTETTTVRLGRREVMRASQPLRAVIERSTPARSSFDLRLELGGEVRSARLLVSWPLEFDGDPLLLGVDGVDGRARLELSVVNRSRRTVPARIDVANREGTGVRDTRDLGALPAGAEARAVFELSGLHPLDLLSGRLTLVFEAGDGRIVQDRAAHRFEPLATDLDRQDLLRYLLRLARDPRSAPGEIDEARALVLLRLREDWTAAVRANGNPYKNDYRLRRAETALGELVQTVTREQAGFVSPEVFRNLGTEIELLADRLPGVHPFLRKYMKRLARRIESA